MSYSANYFTVVRTNRTIKDGMGRSVVSRDDTVKHYNNYEKNGRKS